MQRKMIKSKSGFTLIELIVVIAILAILAGLAVPRLAGYIESAHQANDKQKAAIVCNAAAIYYAVNSNMEVPASSDTWVSILQDQKLILPIDLELKSKAYTDIDISGPNNGVIKVTLSSSIIDDYVYIIEK